MSPNSNSSLFQSLRALLAIDVCDWDAEDALLAQRGIALLVDLMQIIDGRAADGANR